MNSFEKHDVYNLSPSSINQFITCPQKWLLKVAKLDDKSGSPAMWRGTAVDKAITMALESSDLSADDAISSAISIYSECAAESADSFTDEKSIEKRDKELTRVKEYMSAALPHYRAIGVPEDSQQKTEITEPDLPVPIIGYVDLVYRNVIRDIKTVQRLPSTLPDTAGRQMSIYAKATNKLPVLDYINATKTQSRVVVMTVTNTDYHYDVALHAAKAMQKILSISDDIHEVASLLVPDLDDWRWNAKEKINAKKLWRLNDDS